MKKAFVFILLGVCLICLFTGCKAQDSASTPNAGPPAVMVDDILYYSTGKEIPAEINESEFSGRITSTVSISQMPTENGQANIPFQDAPYAKYENGIVVLVDGEWTLFEAREGKLVKVTSSVETSSEPPEKLAAEILSDLTNQEFSIKEDQISDDDYETIVTFGKTFVNLYTGAVAKQETVSFENYISNKNLLKFTNKMLELTQTQELHGRNAVNYGLENEFKEAECKKLDENLCYLKIPFQFEGSGMACELLVQSENKSLKIVDLYFGNKDGVDTIATGHPANRKVDNPKLWDNEAWVQSVFEKLQKYESDLNS